MNSLAPQLAQSLLALTKLRRVKRRSRSTTASIIPPRSPTLLSGVVCGVLITATPIASILGQLFLNAIYSIDQIHPNARTLASPTERKQSCSSRWASHNFAHAMHAKTDCRSTSRANIFDQECADEKKHSCARLAQRPTPTRPPCIR